LLLEADLRGAKLDRAQFLRAELSGARWAGAIGAAETWQGTRCPDGTLAAEHGGSCTGVFAKAELG
jgi:uncharacterized protein YjbI with pentapeptide repeats